MKICEIFKNSQFCSFCDSEEVSKIAKLLDILDFKNRGKNPIENAFLSGIYSSVKRSSEILWGSNLFNLNES